MQLTKILLFGHIVLLLGRTSCNHNRIYYVQLVQNLTDPLEPDDSSFDIDETFGTFDYDKLTVQDRMTMCHEAVQILSERTEGANFAFMKNFGPSSARNYVADMNKESKLVEVFDCPTQPSISLLVYEQSAVQIVSILVRHHDLRTIDARVDEMHYTMKLVKKVLPTEQYALLRNIHIAKRVGACDTGKLPEKLRLEMCRRAMEVGFLANRNIQFLERTATDTRRSYTLQEENNLYTEVQAFACPTVPVIYLEVQDIKDRNGGQTYWIWIIIERAQLPPKFDEDLHYRYQLVIVQSVTPCVVDKSLQLISEEFSEQQRTRMCIEAFQQIHRMEGRNFRFLQNSSPGKSEFYRVHLKTNKPPKEVLAFTCPISPLVYLFAGNPESRNQNVWVILPESQPQLSRLNITGYEVQIFDDIHEVTMERMRQAPAARIQNSPVGPDDLTEEDCRQLCRQAVQMAPKMNINVFPENEFEPGKFYVLKTQNTYVIVLAFKCPTEPEIYVHINSQEGRGNVVWICMKTPKKPHRVLNVVGYRTQFVREITEVPESEVRLKPDNRVRMSSVNTDILEEEERRRLCQHASVQTASAKKIKMSKTINTSESKYYALDRGAETGNSRSSVTRIFVQAFRCPTEPALYLHIGTQEEGDIVWIIIEQREMFPPLEFMIYKLEIVENITEASSHEIREATSSRHGAQFGFDTDTLTEEYRRQLCEKAVDQITEREMDIIRENKTGASQYYSVLETSVGNKKPKIIAAYKCHTEPPVYLEVWESECTILIFVKKSDLIDDSNRVHYIVKFVDSIKEVAPPRSGAYGISESNAVPSTLFSETQRIRMCRNALKQEPLADKPIEFLEDGKPEPNKFYSLDGHKGAEEARVVEAMKCPTRPPVYLQIHFWDFQGYVAWVIVRKTEIVESLEAIEPGRWKEPKELRKSRTLTRQREEEKPSREEIFDINSTSTPVTGKMKEPMQAAELQRWWEQEELSRPTDSRRTREQRAAREEATNINNANMPDSYKIKYVAMIVAASPREISLIPSSPREKSMLDTEKRYVESARIQMCHHAVQILPEQTVQMLSNGITGRSKFFVIKEGFLSETISEFQLVQAFECPSEPPIYLKIRHKAQKGTIATVIVREDKPFGTFMIFQLKMVETIQPAGRNTSRIAGKSRVSGVSREFSPLKRLQMCKQASKVVAEWRVEFIGSVSVAGYEDYILDAESRFSKPVRAFKCPTEPAVYLDVQCRVADEYTVWIIMERPSDGSNLKYKIKYVTDVTRATPRQILVIHERQPDELNPDHIFSEDELMQICQDAIKLFPERRIVFNKNGRRDISRTYHLNVESGSPEFVKAFKCPTTPELYIQVEETEIDQFTIIVIIKRERTSAAIDSPVYELLIVDEIQDAAAVQRRSIYGVSSFSRPSDQVTYTRLERAKMCENVLPLIPGKEFVGWLETRQPGDAKEYVINFKNERRVSQEDRVWAFDCPTEPTIYIQTYTNRSSGRRVIRAIVKRSDLLVVTY